MKLTAVFQKVPEGYIGFVEELPGANTQGATLEETKRNLMEAISVAEELKTNVVRAEMVLEVNRMLAEESLKGQEVIKESLDLAAL
ncbi:MAG: type II toxin-antitoxin system HicB family antitoxin [Deltaproteobacteria bacterium]|nr:type II toxin-antitoxin system HicB family antitoxin [Deltaproteobacteria bacterium]